MIPRYTRPEMGAIFTPEARFQCLLEVEIAVAQAQAKLKIIPEKAVREIKQKAKFSVARIDEIEKTTKHDVIAFVSSVAENVGPSGRYLHYGMTSSDVLNKAAQLLLFTVSLWASLACFAVHADELRGQQVAQFDTDDAYDPFADYSEFEEAQDEEADINFFRNGRFVTIGFIGGLRGFTGGLSELYRPAPSFGLFLSYFFDLRFALQFSFNTSDHGFHVAAPGHVDANGNIGITTFALDIKYYVNTQNVTKGLAAFNPYFIGGFARVDRTTTIQDVQGFGKEGAMGFDLGAGIELPLMRNKMFFGAQAMYQLVNFHDENTQIRFVDDLATGKYPNGDSYTLMGILGVNF